MDKPFKSVEELTQYLLDYDSEVSEDEDDTFLDDTLEDPVFDPNSIPDFDDECETDPVEPPSTSPASQNNIENVASCESPAVQSNYKTEKIIWKKKNLHLNEEQLRFLGNEEIEGELLNLRTPYQFFNYFFGDDLIMHIVNETNLYCTQKNPDNLSAFSATDIKQYISILLYMSLVHLPNIRSYWSADLGYAQINSIMGLKKFEKIRQFLHFNDNMQFVARDQEEHDRLYKLRPILTHLLSKFKSIPLEKELSIDEQMCSTKVRHFMKQYMPMKPHKWGFKLFVLAGVSGYAYNFEIYTGQENKMARPEGEPDFGATSNIVLRLSRIVPRKQNYRLYHDNFYTAIPLMVHLTKQGIFSLGTIRRNRIPQCKLPTEASMKKEPRGTSHEFMTTIDGVDITSLVWKDNKYVNLLSSFAGTHPEVVVRRYDRKQRKTIEVKCPNIIQQYNRHMGGVDLLDSLMGRYKISVKSRKWYMRIFYHLLDLTMVNAWLTYKRVLKINKIDDSEILNQANFRTEVAQCLARMNIASKRGRTSSIEPAIQIKKKKGPAQHVPPREIRNDEIGHWPEHVENKIRCKYPGCQGFSRTKCDKCGVALCLNKSNNCFKNFHIN